MLKTALHIFESEFLDYCLDKIPFNSLSFGNMDYDFELNKKGSKWLLSVYEVCIDHYGKPYRNDLDTLVYDVSMYFH
jgi:hypothetical protein